MGKGVRKNTTENTSSDRVEASGSAASAAPAAPAMVPAKPETIQAPPAPAAPPAPTRADKNPRFDLSARDLEKLHQAFEATGDKRLGQVLDRLCEDPDCELRTEN